MKIAIIGMGVAGVSVLQAMTQFTAYEQQDILLYDTPKTFGTGLPYQPDSEVVLLNQPADTMSLNREQPNDFVAWVEKNMGSQKNEKKHVPRPWFGLYMREMLAQATSILGPRVIQEQVTEIEHLESGGFNIHSTTRTETVDLIHLCTGHLPYQDPYELMGNPHFVYHPYPVKEKLQAIPKGSRVGIIGTGLTALDLMRYLKIVKEEIAVSFFSDKGTFATMRGNEPDLKLQYLTLEQLEEEKAKGKGFVSLDRMFEWFKKECEYHNVNWQGILDRFGEGTKESLENQLEDERDLGALQAIVHLMDAYLPAYWLALNEADKETFLAEYVAVFDSIRSPMPKDTIRELVDLWQKGEITVRGGMKAVTVLPSEFEVIFEKGKTEKVDYLLNATGQMKEVDRSPYQQKVVNHALNTRLLQKEPFGGIQVLWPSSQALSQRYGVVDNLYVHGQLITGVQYGNNTAGMIRDHAYAVVEQIAKQKKL